MKKDEEVIAPPEFVKFLETILKAVNLPLTEMFVLYKILGRELREAGISTDGSTSETELPKKVYFRAETPRTYQNGETREESLESGEERS